MENLEDIKLWSRVNKHEYKPLKANKSLRNVNFIFPRVTIAAVYKDNKYFFGVTVQHVCDADNKKVAQEIAIENALIRPKMVLNCNKLFTKQFNLLSEGIAREYERVLQPINLELKQPRKIKQYAN
jgi:hypothetical protein